MLEVADLDAERAHIVASGWPLDADPTLQPWGLRDFRVCDPDGYYWRLTAEPGAQPNRPARSPARPTDPGIRGT